MTIHSPNDRPSAPQAFQCLISHFLASLEACNLILHIHVVINWQLSKQGIRYFSHHGHALVTLYVQFLCSDWSKFDRWVHAENLCSMLKVVYFDSLRWSLQSFVSTCDVFNCLFPLDVQNEIQLLSRVFCYSWLVCLLGFWLRNAASWNLFTLTAEADRVFCQLVMFLTVFFHWMYKMKFSCYQESSVIHG